MRKCDFPKNSASKVVKMYGAVRVSETRDALVGSLFCFDLFLRNSIREMGNFPAFSFLGRLIKHRRGSNLIIYLINTIRKFEVINII